METEEMRPAALCRTRSLSPPEHVESSARASSERRVRRAIVCLFLRRPWRTLMGRYVKNPSRSVECAHRRARESIMAAVEGRGEGRPGAVRGHGGGAALTVGASDLLHRLTRREKARQ